VIRRTLLGLLTAGLIVLPHAALACSVCMTGRDDETRLAFLLSTGFMSVLPLAAIGGFVWWLRRRARVLALVPAPPVGVVAPAVSRRAS
jgi:hypothetical protein